MTLRGEVPVETVRAGEKALTLSGVDAPLKPVTSVRVRRVNLDRHPRPMLASVRADAIEDGVPIRDLRVSPDLALSVEDENGRRVLVPVLFLANGATILRDPAAGIVTYVTVSLERHDILMGDGMAAESGPGATSDPSSETAAASRRPPRTSRAPDFTPRERGGRCSPVLLGEAAEAIHARLLARAKELGYTETDDPELMVIAGGVVLEPIATGEGIHLYRLPPGMTKLNLRSRSSVPVEAKPATGDSRRLGVALGRLRLGGQQIALDDETCVAGFHPLEGNRRATWRWTTGDATLALPPRTEESVLELAFHSGWGHYWMPPTEPRQAAEA
jgi:hypothetical protein